MKRKAKIIRTNDDKSIIICVDVENADKILKYINRNLPTIKKFNYITDLILNRLRITDVYDKEEINEKCKNVTAMKFFKGGSNDRIYCKEQTTLNKTFVVIAAEVLEKKKSQKITKKNRNIIEKVGSYEYEIIE